MLICMAVLCRSKTIRPSLKMLTAVLTLQSELKSVRDQASHHKAIVPENCSWTELTHVYSCAMQEQHAQAEVEDADKVTAVLKLESDLESVQDRAPHDKAFCARKLQQDLTSVHVQPCNAGARCPCQG